MLWLEPSVSVELRAPDQALDAPGLFLSGPGVVTERSLDAGEVSELSSEETLGSVDDDFRLVDIYRFGRDDGLLAALVLQIPEQHLEDDLDRVKSWLSVAPVPGTLRLVEQQSGFLVSSAETRWCGDRQLMLLRPPRETASAERVRVEVASGLQLLFGDGVLEGWVLEDPEYRVMPLSGDPSSNPPDQELARALRDYLELTTFPSLNALMDGDPAFRESLEELSERIAPGRGAGDRREALRDRIRELIEDNY